MALASREQIRASFSKAAGSYVAQAKHQKSMASLLMNIVASQELSSMNEGSKIIDLGSGTGFVSLEAERQLPLSRVIRLDLSESMLRNDPAYSTSENFICADLQQLPLQTNSVDLCLSSYAFQWANNPEQLFQELNRVLKPGASVFFVIPGKNTFEELKNAWAEVDEHKHVHDFWHQQDIMDFAQVHSMECLHFSQQQDVLRFEHMKAALNHIKKIGAHNLEQNRQKHLLGKAHYFAFRKAFKKHSKLNDAYSLSYHSYFFGFRKGSGKHSG